MVERVLAGLFSEEAMCESESLLRVVHFDASLEEFSIGKDCSS